MQIYAHMRTRHWMLTLHAQRKQSADRWTFVQCIEDHLYVPAFLASYMMSPWNKNWTPILSAIIY